MRRENKLALIVGFSVLLVVAVLVSDHLSTARRQEVADGLDTLLDTPSGRSFVETPLRTDPAIVRGGSGGGGSPLFRAPGDDAGNGGDRFADAGGAAPSPVRTESTDPDTPAYRAPDRGGDDRVIASGPIEFNNGPGARIASGDDSSGMVGSDFDKDLIQRLIENQKLALAQTGNGAGRESTAGATPTRSNSSGPVSSGHVARDNKYVIQPNDTLFEICERLYGDGTKWRELVAINKGRIREDGTVFPGVTIDLAPGVKVSALGSAKPRSSGAQTRSSSSDETRSYTVRKGDTLSEVVQREVGSVRYLDRVRALNPWLEKQKDNIRVGQKITLPVVRHASARGR